MTRESARRAPWAPALAPLLFALGVLLTTRSASADVVARCVASAEQGQAARRASHLIEARARFVECSRAGCPAMIRSDCAKWADSTSERIPTASVRVAGADGQDLSERAQITVDGVALATAPGVAASFDPGRHAFRAEVAGYEPGEEGVVLAEGEHARVVTLTLAPKEKSGVARERPSEAPSPAAGFTATSPTPPPDRPFQAKLVLPLAILGGAALASFGVFAVLGRSEANDLRAGCGSTTSCSEDDVAPARAKYLVADVSLGIGLLALGAAAVLWLTSPAPSAAAAR